MAEVAAAAAMAATLSSAGGVPLSLILPWSAAASVSQAGLWMT